MGQPIPKKINSKEPTFNTLLVDGSNILELSSLGDKTVSSSGKQIGGIFQFLLQLKLMLRRGNFRYVYVFWDGDNSGALRWGIYPMYKNNRDKSYEDIGLSDYMTEVNKKVKSMQQYFFKKKDPEKIAQRKKEKDIFYWQREVIIKCLEELYVRQCVCEYTEADDFIGYYIAHKKPNEKIVIMSNDMDLSQLISDDVIMYVQSKKEFLNIKNHKKFMGYDYRNVALKKIICGDSSDCIKGIKGVGEKTLLTNFKELTEREVNLEEIIEGARMINENRITEGKKPLKWAENIVHRVTDGCQGDKIYEINRKIIDLKHPLMTKESEELLESMMYAPFDDEDRTMENLYKIILENDIDPLKDTTTFGNFFEEFVYLIHKEKNNKKF